jgi:Holliday junction resolvasome RuvABC endonuclease subunit
MPLPKQRRYERIVVGTDPSSEKIACVWNPHGSDQMTLAMSPMMRSSMSPAEKCFTAMTWMQSLVVMLADRCDAVHVWVENPYVGQYPKAAIVLARIQGAVLAGAALGGARWVDDVQPSDWKKVTGKGNANKEAVAAWVAREYEFMHEIIQTKPKGVRQDFCDALGINRHGNRVLDLAQEL